jgi:hypothetical protein
MANEFTKLNADVLSPELWAPELLIAREQVLVAKKAVNLGLFGIGEKVKGDTINVGDLPNLVAYDVGSDGSVTNQTKTIAQVQILLNKWKEATVDIVDLVKIQCVPDMVQKWSQKIAYALGEQEDKDIFSLSDSASITQRFGNKDEDPDIDQGLIASIKMLDRAKVPKSDRWALLYVDMAALIRGKDKFMSAMHVAYNEKGSPIITGELPPLYGLNIQATTGVPIGGTNIEGRRNLICHKEWAAHGMQKNIHIEELARTKKSTPVSGDTVYGSKLMRADHVVVMISKD